MLSVALLGGLGLWGIPCYGVFGPGSCSLLRGQEGTAEQEYGGAEKSSAGGDGARLRVHESERITVSGRDALEAVGGDVTDCLEADTVVEIDGTRIVFTDVEPGAGALGTMLGQDVEQQGRTEAFAGPCGMGAETADLPPYRPAGEVACLVEDDAVSAHGNERAVGVPEPPVWAETAGLLSEEARVGEMNERQHLVSVIAAEGLGDKLGI